MAERLQLRQVYLTALARGLVPPDDPQHPCDLLQQRLPDRMGNHALVRHGSVELPGWQLPKPSLEDFDRLHLPAVEQLLAEGCGALSVQKVEAFVTRNVLPDLPLMAGVDHGQTAGVLRALVADKPDIRLGLVVFDGHLDALSAAARKSALLAAQGRAAAKDEVVATSENGTGKEAGSQTAYHCQSFLLDLIHEETLEPQNLLVAGVYRKPSADLLARLGEGARGYLEEYEALQHSGVQILERDELQADPVCLDRALDRLEVDALYVSLDLDVCASERVPAVRFHDSVGLPPECLIELAQHVRQFVDAKTMPLAGVDVMEMDIHLLDLDPGDRTLELALDFVRVMLGDGVGDV